MLFNKDVIIIIIIIIINIVIIIIIIINGSYVQKKWLLIQCNIHPLSFMGFNWETDGKGDSTLKSYSEPESMCPLNQLETALEMTCF